MLSDLELMQRALEEAQNSPRQVRPNPQVGCALQSLDGKVVSAHHQIFGGAHAEILVLEEAQKKGINIQGATIAVSLEPCSHQGKTPPCAEALVKSGVGRVLVAIEDPNPLVKGQGIARLRENKMEVLVGLGADEARKINKQWLHAQECRRPYITLKMATTLDGRFFGADGNSKWITSQAARERSQLLRKRVDAILTSTKTIEKDNAAFTARENEQDLSLEMQPQVYVLSKDTKKDYSHLKISKHPKAYEWIQKTTDLSIDDILKSIFDNGHYDLLVEAGPNFSSLVLNEFPVDEIWLYFGAKFLGQSPSYGGSALSQIGQGILPGYQVKINDLEKIDEENILLILQPLRK